MRSPCLQQGRTGVAILDLRVIRYAASYAAVKYQIMFRKIGGYYINIDVYIELLNNNNKKRRRKKKLHIVGSNVHPVSLNSLEQFKYEQAR